ncbi:MAG: hypothetical protein KF814_18150 [Nitrospiraceae bacterium]|nr:hypothetical protein [Nitrospiraceae bacterium]
MPAFSCDSVTRTLQNLRSAFSHAFAVPVDRADFTEDELHLIDRIADAVVSRGMAAPAVLFLDSMGPMNFLGSQALHFLTPILDCAFDAGDLDRIAQLLERRNAVSRLSAAIEARSAGQGVSAQ